ncbi:MAG: MEDS domain-containing protein [Thermodesulfobacteriota bacterium]
MKEMGSTDVNIMETVSHGSHVAVFYSSQQDLIEILMPYFRSGLKNREHCMWVISDPFTLGEVREALLAAMENLEEGEIERIEVMDPRVSCSEEGDLKPQDMLDCWVDKCAVVEENGLDGLRVSCNTLWSGKEERDNFVDYERGINDIIDKHKIAVVCTYSLNECGPNMILDVVGRHLFALTKRGDEWNIIESYKRKLSEERLRDELDDLKKINRLLLSRERKLSELRDENRSLKARIDALEMELAKKNGYH